MHKVVRNSYDHYAIWTACDAQGTDNEGYPKSWFYFEVGGFSNRKVSFSVHRVHFLYAMVRGVSLSPSGPKCTVPSAASSTTRERSPRGTGCPTPLLLWG